MKTETQKDETSETLYQDFLQAKRPRIEATGIEPGPVSPLLYPFQADLVRWALRRGQSAIFADCGLGKSFMQIEWARQMTFGASRRPGSRSLIVAPIAVGHQTIAEGAKLGVEITRLDAPSDAPGIHITNYERLHKFVGADYGAIVLDESSILKSLDGETRTLLIKEFSSIPYRLCCTATPAPNDVSELANHAEFLGAMSRVEMLATFFVHDSDEGVWRLKGHAVADMWRWMAQWARFLRRPSDLGYADEGWALPALDIRDEVVQTGLQMELGGIGSRPKVRRATLEARANRVADLILGRQITWTDDKRSAKPQNCGNSPTNQSEQNTPGNTDEPNQDGRALGGSERSTVSLSPILTNLNSSKATHARSVDLFRNQEQATFPGSTLITITPQVKSAAYCVPLATEASDSSLTIPSNSTPQESTFSIEPCVVWCDLNAEEDALMKRLGNVAVSINGKDSEELKRSKLQLWMAGHKPVLVTKARIFGWGLNMQHCHHMIFMGIGDSFEMFYQAIRRCWRFGQAKPVDVRIVVSDIEGAISANVKRKEEEAKIMAQGIIDAVGEEQVTREHREDVYEPKTIGGEKDGNEYVLMLGDCVERAKEIPDASVGFSIYSPPFASLYTYSSSARDMGNCKDYDQFFKHYAYLIPELLRVTKPGRRTAVHVAQVPTSKATHGVIAWRDFRADVVKAYAAGGWIYDGEIVIDKDPQAQAIRTKSKQLMFVQKERDSSWLRPAMADYILLFRHPVESKAEPVKSDVSNEEWILFARPIWYAIKETNVLRSYRNAREDDDEKHICPLQLETIERCIRLWSNPGDIVLSPFAGIGSEGYVSLRHGRNFIGIELKEAYWKQAQQNLTQALEEGRAPNTVPTDLPIKKVAEAA